MKTSGLDAPWRHLLPAALVALLLAPILPTLAHASDDDAGAPDAAVKTDAPAQAKVAAEDRARAEQRLKQAQERMESAAREMAEVSIKLSDEHGAMEQAFMVTHERRAQLGMAIDMRNGEKAGDGVRVISVSPGGPAEAAGVRANDVVTSLNGTPLKGDGTQPAARQLLAILHDAKPGESLPIEFRREGKLVKARVLPGAPAPSSERLEDLMLPGMPPGHAFAGPDGRPAMHEMEVHMFRHEGGFGGTELAELSPGLGSYFGTDKGLLVVRAPADGRFKLQDGDVLLDIDGRVPASVGHALQILGSYHAGEKVRLHLMRQKQKLELAIEVPGAG
jgi:C-terminal processing protease CtpA/Prc